MFIQNKLVTLSAHWSETAYKEHKELSLDSNYTAPHLPHVTHSMQSCPKTFSGCLRFMALTRRGCPGLLSPPACGGVGAAGRVSDSYFRIVTQLLPDGSLQVLKQGLTHDSYRHWHRGPIWYSGDGADENTTKSWTI